MGQRIHDVLGALPLLKQVRRHLDDRWMQISIFATPGNKPARARTQPGVPPKHRGIQKRVEELAVDDLEAIHEGCRTAKII